MFLFIKRLFDIFLFIFNILSSNNIYIFFFYFSLISKIIFLERSGINGKTIKIVKLQTMKNINEKKNITKLGKILRVSKIDELPQLISVIKNDMSLIGPRPLYKDFNRYYKEKHRSRLLIKPGLTGLAQIKVKDSTDWKKKFNFDSIYVKKASYSLDLYIIIKTFIIIINSIFVKNNRAIETIDYKNFFENYCK